MKAKLPWNGLKRNISEDNKHRFQELFIRKFPIVQFVHNLSILFRLRHKYQLQSRQYSRIRSDDYYTFRVEQVEGGFIFERAHGPDHNIKTTLK